MIYIFVTQIVSFCTNERAKNIIKIFNQNFEPSQTEYVYLSKEEIQFLVNSIESTDF